MSHTGHRTHCITYRSQNTLHHTQATEHLVSHTGHKKHCITHRSQNTLSHTGHRTPCITHRSQNTMYHIQVIEHIASHTGRRTRCITHGSQNTLYHTQLTNYLAFLNGGTNTVVEEGGQREGGIHIAQTCRLLQQRQMAMSILQPMVLLPHNYRVNTHTALSNISCHATVPCVNTHTALSNISCHATTVFQHPHSL